MHELFEWDDSAAAEQYRLVQARYVLRSVVVTYQPAKDGEREIRNFVLIRDSDHRDRGYLPLGEVLSRPTDRRALLAQALAEAENWWSRYELLAELAPVRRALDEVRRGMPRRRSKQRSARRHTA